MTKEGRNPIGRARASGSVLLGRGRHDESARFTYYDTVGLVGFIIEAVTKPQQ